MASIPRYEDDDEDVIHNLSGRKKKETKLKFKVLVIHQRYFSFFLPTKAKLRIDRLSTVTSFVRSRADDRDRSHFFVSSLVIQTKQTKFRQISI